MGAGDRSRNQATPSRQQMPVDEIARLLPATVRLLRVLAEIAFHELGEGAGRALRPPLPLRVFPLRLRVHDLLGEAAGLAEADLVDGGEVIPAGAALECAHTLIRLVAVRPDEQRQPLLLGIPGTEWGRLRANPGDVELRQLPFVSGAHSD